MRWKWSLILWRVEETSTQTWEPWDRPQVLCDMLCCLDHTSHFKIAWPDWFPVWPRTERWVYLLHNDIHGTASMLHQIDSRIIIQFSCFSVTFWCLKVNELFGVAESLAIFNLPTVYCILKQRSTFNEDECSTWQAFSDYDVNCPIWLYSNPLNHDFTKPIINELCVIMEVDFKASLRVKKTYSWQ